MKIENEITVLVSDSFEKLHNSLISNNFKVVDKYVANDIYMIDKNIDLSKFDSLEILKKCAIVREITGYTKVLLYKHKEYNENGDILVNGKIECPIEDINKGISFLEAINYQKLIEIHDECTVYVNNEIELIVQYVNDKYLLFEVEEECRNINKVFSSIDEIKDVINKYNYHSRKIIILLKKPKWF